MTNPMLLSCPLGINSFEKPVKETDMSKITACIDGSEYTNAVCTMAGWASKRMNVPVALLHTVADHHAVHSLIDSGAVDYSGQIGLGAKSDLLQKLADLDEQHGKLAQQRGQLVLEHASQILDRLDVKHSSLHRRGDFIELANEQCADSDLFIAGKRGEKGAGARGILGSHVEALARSIQKPLLVTPHAPEDVTQVMIAYDASASSEKAVAFAASNPLLAGLECHMVMVCKDAGAKKGRLTDAEKTLSDAGLSVQSQVIESASVDEAVTSYIEEKNIHMLLMGAYGHSPIRRFFLGSTTSAQIAKTQVPVLLFR